jgi:hypothetical protein
MGLKSFDPDLKRAIAAGRTNDASGHDRHKRGGKSKLELQREKNFSLICFSCFHKQLAPISSSKLLMIESRGGLETLNRLIQY